MVLLSLIYEKLGKSIFLIYGIMVCGVERERVRVVVLNMVRMSGIIYHPAAV